MKKPVTILLIVLLMLGITSCSKQPTEAEKQKELEENYERYAFDDLVFYFPKDREYQIDDDGELCFILSDRSSFLVMRMTIDDKVSADDFIAYYSQGNEIKSLANGIRYFLDETAEGSLSAVRENDSYRYLIVLNFFDEDKNHDIEEDEAFIQRVQIDPAAKIREESKQPSVFRYNELIITVPEELELAEQDTAYFSFDYVLADKSFGYILFVQTVDKKEMRENGYSDEQLEQMLTEILASSETEFIETASGSWYTVFDEVSDNDNAHYVRSFVDCDDYFYQVVQRCEIKDKELYNDLMVEIAELLMAE